MVLCLRTKTEKEFEEDDGGGNWKRRRIGGREREGGVKAAAGNRVDWRCFVEILSSDLT